MSFELDVEKRAMEKIAGIGDMMSNAYNGVANAAGGLWQGLTGSTGQLSSPLYGAMGAGLGALAGSHGGTPGMIGGALMGGMGGLGITNAINANSQQGGALAGAVSGALGMGDSVDQQQNAAIMQQGAVLDNLVSYMSQIQPALEGAAGGMMGGGMDQGMMDPSMMQQGGMDSQFSAPQMQPPAQGGGQQKKSSLNVKNENIKEAAFVEAVASAVLNKVING